MAVSPEDAEDLAAGVVDAYVQAELGVFGRLAYFLGLGLNSDSWVGDRRGQASVVRRAVSAVLGPLFSRGRKAAAKATVEAERRGTAKADEELGAAAEGLASSSGVHAKQGNKLLGKDLSTVESTFTKQALTVYQRVITEVSTLVEAGTATRTSAAARALARFASVGITGFVDKAGRNWELASYVEMAVRTRTAQVMVEAHRARLAEAGVNLVLVSQAPYECPLCKPWEGKVLDASPKAPEGKRSVKVDAVGGKGSVTVQVAGSLDEARRKGLFHPNCRHSISGYLAGVTRVPEKPTTKTTYEDTQRLRALERRARKWDRRKASALTDDQKALADQRYKETRAEIRAHVAKTGLPRKTNRERQDAAR